MKEAAAVIEYRAPENLAVTIANVEKGVERQLAAATTVDQVRMFVAAAEAAKAFVRSLGKEFRDSEARLEVLRFEGEERLGHLLNDLPKATGSRGRMDGKTPEGKPKVKSSGGSELDPPEKPATLAELGITKKAADRARKLAALSPETKEAIKSGDTTIARALAPTKAEKVEKVKVAEKKSKDVEAELRAKIARLEAENETLRMDLQEQKDAAFEALAVAEALQHLQDNTHVKRIKDLEVENRAMRSQMADYQRESASRLTQIKLEQKNVRRLEGFLRKNGLEELLRPQPAVAVAA